jgi:glucose uptake protein GlcU
MSESPERPRWSDIYREQYREISASKTKRAFRWITPIALLVVAVLAVVLGHGDHAFLTVILGAVAVVLLVATVVLTLRQRARESSQGRSELGKQGHGASGTRL